jgi:flagellar basal body-associated protein FliL
MYIEMYIIISLLIVSIILAVGIVGFYFYAYHKMKEEYEYAEEMEYGLDWMIMNTDLEASKNMPEVVQIKHTFKALAKIEKEEKERKEELDKVLSWNY